LYGAEGDARQFLGDHASGQAESACLYAKELVVNGGLWE